MECGSAVLSPVRIGGTYARRRRRRRPPRPRHPRRRLAFIPRDLVQQVVTFGTAADRYYPHPLHP